MVWSRTTIGAAIWPRSLPVKRRSAMLTGAAILGGYMKKLFGTRAHAILNELGYHYHEEHMNQQL
eukprot:4467252-Pleurochrysis_carterae.AAC.1